jgi:ATP-dependent Clp protease protease subunit
MQNDRDEVASALSQALFDRRIILASGTVTDEKAAELAGALLTLDALGDEPIELRINARADSLAVALSLVDIIDTLGVTVHATVTGELGGTMVGPLAVCHRRRIGPSGRIELREPEARYVGTASQIQLQAESLEQQWNRYLHRLEEATGQPFEHLEADHRAGRFLDPTQALAYGLVDEILPALPRPRA